MDNNMWTNDHILRIPEVEGKGSVIENIPYEIIAKTTQVSKEVRVSRCKKHQNRPLWRHITAKCKKYKNNNSKRARDKCVMTYNRIAIRLRADFPTGTLQARREGDDLWKIVKENNWQPRIPYTVKSSLQSHGGPQLWSYPLARPRQEEHRFDASLLNLVMPYLRAKQQGQWCYSVVENPWVQAPVPPKQTHE